MKTVSSLLDKKWYERYKAISKLNIRSSIYDVTNKCNLRCKGCFFFSSDEHKAAAEEMDIQKWGTFVDKEMARGEDDVERIRAGRAWNALLSSAPARPAM